MDRPTLFIAGHHATGKTELAKHLFETRGYPFIDLGPTIRTAHVDSGSVLNLGDWVNEQELVHGINFTDDITTNAFRACLEKNPGNGPVVVNGSRSYPGLEYIVKSAEVTNHRIMYVVSRDDLLYERFINREGIKDASADQFQRLLQRDRDMGVEGIQAKADWIVRNCGELATYYAEAKCHIDSWL